MKLGFELVIEYINFKILNYAIKIALVCYHDAIGILFILNGNSGEKCRQLLRTHISVNLGLLFR